jgi:hypothetical protein
MSAFADAKMHTARVKKTILLQIFERHYEIFGKIIF